MKNIIVAILISVISFSLCNAQEAKYRRSSIYSILIRHPEKEFGKDIDTVFRMIPVPAKFDDHNLKIRAINAGVQEKNKKTEEENVRMQLDEFIKKNEIAKRLVSKWFNRKSGRGQDGTFDVDLIIERGLYDASYADIQIARQSARGLSMLADAGEELIGNTYVLFNDIKYIDKEEESGLAAAGIALVGAIASSVTGGLTSVLVSYGTDAIVGITEKISGFRVVVTSYLYRLDWNEDIAATFYSDYYISSPDPQKKKAYEDVKGLFTLTYVGCEKTISSKTTMAGVNNKNDMIRKVCERALDKSIAMLQHNHSEFRIKTPLYSVEPLTAKIGLKEDVNENVQYEVLEMVETDEGKTDYNRVGIIRPIKGKIWDNRYMAEFEEENAPSITATEFEKVSGSDFYPGMLIREL